MLNIHDLPVFQRFIRLCAARTGQLLNFSSLATDCGIAQSTAKTWLGVLEASYLVFRLPPHPANFGKRLVKTPKLYFYDTGLASALLSIQNLEQMNIHPFRPALFETLIVSEHCKARMAAALPRNLYFWRDNTGNEVDLVLDEGLKLVPVEIKSGQTVAADFFKGLTRWLGYAGEQAGEPVLVYGGENSYIRQGIKVVSWRKL